jgi:hypothetical protein
MQGFADRSAQSNQKVQGIVEGEEKSPRACQVSEKCGIIEGFADRSELAARQ